MVGLVGLFAAVVLVAAVAVFQPWRLFVDTRIDEALPAVPAGQASTSATAAGSKPIPEPRGPGLKPARPSTSALPVKQSTSTPPTSTPEPPANQTIRSGRLISHEHPTSGDISIIQQTDGTKVLRIEDLKTTNGPDLRVWLSSAPVHEGRAGWFVFKDHDHLELGALKANQGNQNYLLPAAADLDEFGSVTIWCKRFSVSFGAAELVTP